MLRHAPAACLSRPQFIGRRDSARPDFPLLPIGKIVVLMKRAASPAPVKAAHPTPAQLRKQALKVFGGGTTVQLFGSGGRVLTGDGRRLEFANMKEWARLVERERPASKPPPSRATRSAAAADPPIKASKSDSPAAPDAKKTDESKKRGLRFIWEML